MQIKPIFACGTTKVCWSSLAQTRDNFPRCDSLSSRGRNSSRLKKNSKNKLEISGLSAILFAPTRINSYKILSCNRPSHPSRLVRLQFPSFTSFTQILNGSRFSAIHPRSRVLNVGGVCLEVQKADTRKPTIETSLDVCCTSLLPHPTHRWRNRMFPHLRSQSRGGIPSSSSKTAIKIQKNLKSMYHSSYPRNDITARIHGRNIREPQGGLAKDISQPRPRPSGLLRSRKGS